MRLPITLSEIGPRISAGAFILNSGLGKRGADEGPAAGLHGFASGAYPFLEDVDPKTFVKALSYGEIAIGAALLTPFVPTAVAGAAPTAFSGGLLGIGVGLAHPRHHRAGPAARAQGCQDAGQGEQGGGQGHREGDQARRLIDRGPGRNPPAPVPHPGANT